MTPLVANPSQKAIASARRIEQLLALFYDGGSDGLAGLGEPDVVDLLADLRHYCDAQGHDFARLSAKAYGLYLPERERYDMGETAAEQIERLPMHRLRAAAAKARDLADGEAVDAYIVLSTCVDELLERSADPVVEGEGA